MKQLTAFTKKEFMELIRTGKALLLMILFILFGIMNPAIAKLTPWLLETMNVGGLCRNWICHNRNRSKCNVFMGTVL